MNIITIGCDPGHSTGLAAWVGDQLVYVTTIKQRRQDAALRARALHKMYQSIDPRGVPVAFVCEAQFLPEDDPKRFPSVVKIIEAATRWEERALSIVGIRVHDRVYQSSWRSTFGLGSRKIKKKAARAKLAMSKLYPRFPWTEDAAEAALIGLHVHLQRSSELDPDLAAKLYLETRRIKSHVCGIENRSRDEISYCQDKRRDGRRKRKPRKDQTELFR